MGRQTDDRNYYELLHVSPDAPVEIIKGSYRTLMQQLKHHPDLGGDTVTAAFINEAYAVLSHPERRADYDARLALLANVSDGVAEASPEVHAAADAKPKPDLSRACVFCHAPHSYGSVIEIDTCCPSCMSPLYTAERSRMESGGQRAVARIEKQQRITYYTRWPQSEGHTGYIEDLSLNGLRLVTRRDLVEGQCIKIVSDVVEAVAQVTHRIHERRGWTTRCVAGMSFLTLRFGRSVGGFVSNRV